MKKTYSNLGLNNGVPPSTLTTEESRALFLKNQANHPPTRISRVEKVLSSMTQETQTKQPAPLQGEALRQARLKEQAKTGSWTPDPTYRQEAHERLERMLEAMRNSPQK